MIAALLLGLTASAADIPCDPADGMALGPLQGGIIDGDLGTPRRVCPRTEIGLAPGGSLLVDAADFYGNISGGADVDASIALNERTELFGRIQTLRYESVISAISETYVGVGDTALGATRVVHKRKLSSVAFSGRAVLPTAFGLYQNAWPIGIDAGLAGAYATSPSLRLQAATVVHGSFALSRARAQPRVGFAPTVGAQWRPGRAFALVGQVSSSFFASWWVDHIAPGLGFRFSDGRRFGIELDTQVPVYGRDRTLAVVELRSTIRLGALK